MLSDPIADMLTRIRNGHMAMKKTVVVACSNLNEEVLKILKNQNYIDGYKKIKQIKKGKETPFFDFAVKLSYRNGQPAIEKIERLSTPGRRLYTKGKHLKQVLSGYGISIISTPKGIMTNKEAKKRNLGGEVLCRVW